MNGDKSINWWRTDLVNSESSAVSDAIINKNLSSGPLVKEFEDAFSSKLKVKYSIACPSGSMSLVMAMLAYNIGCGDEVIVPCSTWISTAHAPLLVGAKTVLVDVLHSKPVIDHSKIERKITSKTKAIIAVHLNGCAANLKAIKEIAYKYKLIVIEDACQALLSKNKEGYLGTQSNIGCFSFGVTKLITTSQGGMLVTNNKETYDKLLLIRNNGVESVMTPNYKCFGLNFKFSDILASIGIEQIKQIEKHAESVTKIYAKYENKLESLKSIKLIKVDYKSGELPLYVEIISENRDNLMKYFAKNGIYTRAIPPALIHSPILSQDGTYAHSKYFSDNGMYLPCGPHQTNKDVNKVIKVLIEYDKMTMQ